MKCESLLAEIGYSAATIEIWPAQGSTRRRFCLPARGYGRVISPYHLGRTRSTATTTRRNGQVTVRLATLQHKGLHHSLIRCGQSILVVSQASGHPGKLKPWRETSFGNLGSGPRSKRRRSPRPHLAVTSPVSPGVMWQQEFRSGTFKYSPAPSWNRAGGVFASAVDSGRSGW